MKKKAAIIDFIHHMPFEEKKRLLATVISPKNEGRIVLRYPTPAELAEEGQHVKNWNQPLIDQGVMVEMRYRMDLDRISSFITNLNNKD